MKPLTKKVVGLNKDGELDIQDTGEIEEGMFILEGEKANENRNISLS